MANFYDIYEKYNRWNELSDEAKKMAGMPTLSLGGNPLGGDYSKYEPLFTEYEKLMNGQSTDFLGFQNLANQYGLSGSQFEKWLDNMISKQNQKDAFEQDLYARDTSYLSTGDQLAQLGLGSSGVLQTGGAVTPNIGAAQNSHENISLREFTEKNAMTRSILSMIGQLGSAGIHGGSLVAAKKAASGLAYRTARSVFDYL